MNTVLTVSPRRRPGRAVALVLCILLSAAGCNGKAPPTTMPIPLPPTATPLPPTATPVPASSLVDTGYRALAQSDFNGAIGLFAQAADRHPAYTPALYHETMGHQPAYREQVEALVGPVDHHRWQSDTTLVFGRQDGTRVQIVIGPDAPTVETVAMDLN